MPEPVNFKQGQRLGAQSLNAAINSRISDIRVGPGLLLQRIGSIATIGLSSRPVAGAVEGSDVRLVRITSNFGTTAYGKYNARTLTPTTITYTNWTATTGAPSSSSMLGSGSEASADDVIFLNLEELGNGGSTYVLTNGVTDSGDIYAIGRVVGRIPNDSGTYGSNANKLLIAGLSLKYGACS